MRYLKKFESLFGTAEPERITHNEFHLTEKDRCVFTEKELLYLESLFDRNRKKIYDVEYNKGGTFMYNKFTLEKEEVPDNFLVLLYPNTQNGELIDFECYKHSDDWFYICIYQESDSYDEDEIIPGFMEYWRCDEFDSLKKLLDKWI